MIYSCNGNWLSSYDRYGRSGLLPGVLSGTGNAFGVEAWTVHEAWLINSPHILITMLITM
jgi:hypothetical protein